jgi:hypothetical protein
LAKYSYENTLCEEIAYLGKIITCRKSFTNKNIKLSVTVPDPGSQDRDVVLTSAGLLGKPKRGGGEFGIGRGWGGDEEREVSSRATWDQGGQGHIHQRRVSK